MWCHCSNHTHTKEDCSRVLCLTNTSRLTAHAQRDTLCRFMKTVIHAPTRTDIKVMTTFFSHSWALSFAKRSRTLSFVLKMTELNFSEWLHESICIFCLWGECPQLHRNVRFMLSFESKKFPVSLYQEVVSPTTYVLLTVLSSSSSTSLKRMCLEWCLHIHCS